MGSVAGFAPPGSARSRVVNANRSHVVRPQALSGCSRLQQPGQQTHKPAHLNSRAPLAQRVQFRHCRKGASTLCPATGGGNGPPSGGGPPVKPPTGPEDHSGAGDKDPEDDDEELLGPEEAEQIAASEKIHLPQDFLEAAAGEGLRRSVLEAFVKLQRGWLTALLSKSAWFRDRLLYDSRFLFIVLAEIAIDTACATIAEVRKRGDEFWSEFEFYLSDLIVGLVLDVLLVGLMATPAVIGKHHKAHNAKGFKKWVARTPKAIFEANTAGEPAYTVGQRLFCLVVKFGEYSLAGITCGIIGQGVANGLMKIKRSIVGAHEDDLAAPPILLTGLTWGAFMGGSSNLRYQSVFAVERLVDKTLAKSLPKAPYIISFVLRLFNNILGGENFIDHARWTGIQPSSEHSKA